MTLISLLLNLWHRLHFVDEIELQELRSSCDAWEKRIHNQDATKLQQLYAKLHTGIVFKLISPILFIFLKRYIDDMMNGKIERGNYTEIE